MKRGGALALVLLISLLALFVIVRGAPERSTGTVGGVIVGVHQNQSHDGRGAMVARVRLETGVSVDVLMSAANAVHLGRRVELEALRREWPPRSTRYRFLRYEAETPAR